MIIIAILGCIATAGFLALLSIGLRPEPSDLPEIEYL